MKYEMNELWCRNLLEKDDLDYNKFYKHHIEFFLDISRKDNKELKKEINRLNNIIEELEEYLIDMFNKTQDTKYCDDLIKLKELKEGEKK